MQGIKAFIQQEILVPRLQKEGVLVVYDPEERYRELCMELGNGSVSVIDTWAGSIPGREKALETFNCPCAKGLETKVDIFIEQSGVHK